MPSGGDSLPGLPGAADPLSSNPSPSIRPQPLPAPTRVSSYPLRLHLVSPSSLPCGLPWPLWPC